MKPMPMPTSHRSIFIGSLLILLIVACSTSTPAQSGLSQRSDAVALLQQDSQSTATSNSHKPDDQIDSEKQPELWVFGVQASPADAAKIGAAGVRGIIDLRKFNLEKIRSMIRQYADLNLGFCLTLRWKPDPSSAINTKGKRKRGRGGDREDVPPTEVESERSIQQIIELLQSPDAKKLSGKLWVQLYNEISGGPGRFGEDAEDAMFAYATKLAVKLRQEVPYVKICGPALTGVEVLTRSQEVRNKKRMSQLRYQRLQRTIQWSAKYADAVDIHLHAESGEWVDQSLRTVRQVLNEQPGGSKIKIVSWEWSCARFKNHDDQQAIHQVLVDIWGAMSKNGVAMAAYASYWPGKKQKPIYQWKSIVTKEGQPHEPFYSFFVDLAEKVNH